MLQKVLENMTACCNILNIIRLTIIKRKVNSTKQLMDKGDKKDKNMQTQTQKHRNQLMNKYRRNQLYGCPCCVYI